MPRAKVSPDDLVDPQLHASGQLEYDLAGFSPAGATVVQEAECRKHKRDQRGDGIEPAGQHRKRLQRMERLKQSKPDQEVREKAAQGEQTAYPEHILSPPPAQSQVRKEEDQGSDGARVNAVNQPGDQDGSDAQGLETPGQD